MTKRADPTTFPGAVARIVGGLTATVAAAAVGRSEQTVYNWQNPEGDHLPSITQALRLDATYVAAGLGVAPIFSVYARLLERSAEIAQAPADVRLEMLDVITSAGALAETIKGIIEHNSEAGAAISENELRAALIRIADARAQLDDVEAALRGQVVK